MTPEWRRQMHIAATLTASAFALLGVAWIGGNPIAAAPDEGAHFVKAFATVDGQLRGEPFVAEPAGLRPRAASWFLVAGRSYWMPTSLVPTSSARCYSTDPDRTADCQDFTLAAGDPHAPVRVNNHLGTYNPFPYLVTGLALRGADDFRSAMRRGRFASLAVCTIFLSWATALLCRRGVVPLAGLVLATTPAVVFLSASLNTSGIEITSAICVWSALLVLARESAPKGGAWSALAVAGTVLALTRPLGAVMLSVSVAITVCLAGIHPSLAAIKRARIRALCCTAVLLAACGLSFLWVQVALPHPPTDLGLAARSVGRALRDLPNEARDVIGIFGWNDTTMPIGAYILGLGLLAGLGVLALIKGSPRERSVLIVLGLITIALDLGLAVLVEAQIGFGMQARYVMPLAVGLPLVAADVVQVHLAGLRQKTIRLLLATAYSGAAVLQLTAFVSNEHRYAVGASGAWLPPWDSRWSPDGGLAVWIAVAVAGSFLLAIAAMVASRAGLSVRADTVAPTAERQRVASADVGEPAGEAVC